MNSIWQDSCLLPSFESQRGTISTEVLIIGGGIAGILCAHMLNQAGIDCVLAEADTICSGITKNTTAKITAQHGLIYHKLIREFGVKKAKAYLQANEDALKTYKNLCMETDCDFEIKDSFVYSLNNPHPVREELSALKKLGYPAESADNLSLPFPVAGAVRFGGQAQFHPLKLISFIADNLHIIEHTRVKELIGTTAVTDHGKIHAEKIIVTTHFPFLNKHGSYFIKMYQHRSYVLALSGAPDVNGMYVDEDMNGLSLRNYHGLLLLGGGSHRTGKTGGNYDELRKFAGRYYPDATEKYHWATQDCMTLDGIPYIGAYSKNTKNIYVATGFNKWGMTSSMAAAKILCSMIKGEKNPLSDVFSPERTILRPQLAANMLSSTAGLLTPGSRRCSHLKCTLKWNPCERTWDCPCHGSRFTEKGEVIDNPATDDL